MGLNCLYLTMEFSNEVLFFGGFAVFVIFVMMLDLGAFSKSESHVVKFKEAAIWSGVWVLLAVSFYFFLRHYGYLIHDISTPEALEIVRGDLENSALVVIVLFPVSPSTH